LFINHLSLIMEFCYIQSGVCFLVTLPHTVHICYTVTIFMTSNYSCTFTVYILYMFSTVRSGKFRRFGKFGSTFKEIPRYTTTHTHTRARTRMQTHTRTDILCYSVYLWFLGCVPEETTTPWESGAFVDGMYGCMNYSNCNSYTMLATDLDLKGIWMCSTNMNNIFFIKSLLRSILHDTIKVIPRVHKGL